MDFDSLDGPQRAVLRQAILSAFTSPNALGMFLEGKLARPPLRRWAGGGDFTEITFKVIAASQAEGWTGDLVAALQAERPRNPLVRNLPEALRLTEHPQLPPAAEGMTFEKVVRGGGFADVHLWAERLSSIGQAVCRVECPIDAATTYGTGLLVSDDLVLTNYHVVEGYIDGKASPASIRCRFDYARDVKGLSEGRCVALAAGDGWKLAYSRYDDADKTGVGSPSPNNLDFVLLRLAEPAARDEVGGGQRRGSIPIRSRQAVPAPQAPVFILQHPDARPLALSIGIVQQSPTDNRIRYDADTEPGSSGSGVFNQQLELVALHHTGQKGSTLTTAYNQGIPIARIIEVIGNEKIAEFWV